MPERASVTQGIQIGVETVPGTPVAANRLLTSLSIEPGIQFDFNRFRPIGQKVASIITPGREWVESGISGVGSYSEIMYLLSSILKNVTPVQQGGTTAYKWTYDPAVRTEDTVKTYTVEQGSTARAHKHAYGLVTEVGMTYTRSGIEVSGAMVGQALTDAITLTGSPTAVEEKPMLPKDTTVYLDTTSAGLGGTALARVLEASWTIGDRFNPVWRLMKTDTSFVSHVETEPTAQVTLLVEADSEGMGILTAARAGGTRFLRIRSASDDLAGTAFPYIFDFDCAVKVSDVDDFSDSDGVYAVRWTFDVVYDNTWGKWLQPAVTNKQTAL